MELVLANPGKCRFGVMPELVDLCTNALGRVAKQVSASLTCPHLGGMPIRTMLSEAMWERLAPLLPP